MKKPIVIIMKISLITMLALIFGSYFFFLANDDKAIRFEQLPKKAQDFIKTYYSGDSISYANKETELYGSEYEVYLMNGDKLKFRSNGECKKVRSYTNSVPQQIIPKQIMDYVLSKFSGEIIVEYEYDCSDYERYTIKLSSGIELMFDSKYVFIGYDD